jgi:hypothetical protein
MKHVKLFEQYVSEAKTHDAALAELEALGKDTILIKNRKWNIDTSKLVDLLTAVAKTKDSYYFDDNDFVKGDKTVMTIKSDSTSLGDLIDALKNKGIISEAKTFFSSEVNEGYSSSDIKKLKEFAEEVSREIIDDFADNRKFDEDEYTPEEMFNYIKEWGEMNNMSVKEVMDEFEWRYMTDELGLPRAY